MFHFKTIEILVTRYFVCVCINIWFCFPFIHISKYKTLHIHTLAIFIWFFVSLRTFFPLNQSWFILKVIVFEIVCVGFILYLSHSRFLWVFKFILCVCVCSYVLKQNPRFRFFLIDFFLKILITNVFVKIIHVFEKMSIQLGIRPDDSCKLNRHYIHPSF